MHFDELTHGWVFRSRESELLSRLEQELAKCGYRKVKATSDYVYATGPLPVMLVAHGDTVHRMPPEDIFYDERRGVLWSPQGLGADDRAGVLGILEVLRRGYRPHVLVTLGEESGGTGAHAFVREVPDSGVRYIVELDRRNSGEAVFYDCPNEAFKKYVLSFGFREAAGIYTDIMVLCPAWNVAGVNLSCGYYDAHQKTEYLRLPDLAGTLDRLVSMLDSVPRQRFKYGKRRKRGQVGLSAAMRRTAYDYIYGDVYADWEYEWELRGCGVESGTSRDLPKSGGQFWYLDAKIAYADLVDLYGGTKAAWKVILSAYSDFIEEFAERAALEAVEYLVDDPYVLQLLSRTRQSEDGAEKNHGEGGSERAAKEC